MTVWNVYVSIFIRMVTDHTPLTSKPTFQIDMSNVDNSRAFFG